MGQGDQERRAEDQQLGFDRVPDRYARGDRETIDLIRDAMTDPEFVAYCRGQVIRYRSRAGAKGPAEVDETKAVFYEQMAAHVSEWDGWMTSPPYGEPLVHRHRDPRAYRDGFTPYQRKAYPDGLFDVRCRP